MNPALAIPPAPSERLASLWAVPKLAVAKGARDLPCPDLPLADRANMVCLGTTMAAGQGRALVAGELRKAFHFRKETEL